jgi:hypothetical protein
MSANRKHVAEFDDFVKRQQVSLTETKSFDWKQERDEWLAYLAELYRIVELHLKPYVEGNTITISYRDISLNEENIGQYQARQMIVKIGRQEVVFTPVGTVLIGTKGRVDVEGAAGKARLILTDRNATRPEVRVSIQRDGRPSSAAVETKTDIEWTWKILTSPPNVSYIELTQESLFDLVMEVANG